MLLEPKVPTYTYMYVYICIYIYIYMVGGGVVYVYMYTYIHICIGAPFRPNYLLFGYLGPGPDLLRATSPASESSSNGQKM